MTTLQLARSAARHLGVPDPSDLGGDALLDVLAACNSGLQQFYREAPPLLKRSTISTVFRAPMPVALAFLAKYDNHLDGEPFDLAWLGCGLRVAGQTPDNEITGPSTVLDSWLGSTLTTTGLVLFDSVSIPGSIERLVSPPRLYYGSNRALELRPDREGLIRNRRDLTLLSPAQPTHYAVDSLGAVLGGQTASLLRIHPAPTQDCTVRFEVELAALTLNAGHIAIPTDLPILNQYAEELLVPLVEAALTISPLWRNPETIRLVADRAADVLVNKIPRLAHTHAPADYPVGTPEGF
jgi:hypothetical protein